MWLSRPLLEPFGALTVALRFLPRVGIQLPTASSTPALDHTAAIRSLQLPSPLQIVCSHCITLDCPQWQRQLELAEAIAHFEDH
jgi:hypothetical protein